jgi:lipopolysaccharide biosynthesis glycosyltransferase
MSETLRVFIGYDTREIVAYHTLAQSIIEHSSKPVTFCPIAAHTMKGLYTRDIHALASTEFSFSRFLVPHLSGYEGWSLFMDCDMLVYEDIADLFALADDRYAAMCVQHDYVPRDEIKFLNAPQTKYPKKNWSSFILFNNAKCRALTPEYVNSATGLELHQFKWLENDNLIGSLPAKWNHLVGEYDKIEKPANVHFTVGGPYFNEYKTCDYADDWFAMRAHAASVSQRS